MLRQITARLALIPVIVFGVVTLLFIIFKTIPGDEAALMRCHRDTGGNRHRPDQWRTRPAGG